MPELAQTAIFLGSRGGQGGKEVRQGGAQRLQLGRAGARRPLRLDPGTGPLGDRADLPSALDYTFAEHARYLDAWFAALDLPELVLVGLDWGGALAFDRAARQPRGVLGIAVMEAVLRPTTWAEFPAGARDRFRALRTPGVGERLALEENVFIEQALRQTVLHGLSDEDFAVYAAPYPTPASRRPLLGWPRAWPIEGDWLAPLTRRQQ